MKRSNTGRITSKNRIWVTSDCIRRRKNAHKLVSKCLNLCVSLQTETCTQVYILTLWAQTLLYLGPWEGGQQSGRSSMIPGGSTVSKCGCEEVKRQWLHVLDPLISFWQLLVSIPFLLLSSRAGVYPDPADPWQCRKEWWQALLLFPGEESRHQWWGEPHCFSPGGESVSGKQNHATNQITPWTFSHLFMLQPQISRYFYLMEGHTVMHKCDVEVSNVSLMITI